MTSLYLKIAQWGVLLWGIAFSLIVGTSVAQSSPLGLQTGGAGEGYVFSSVTDKEWQSQLRYLSSRGSISFDELVGERLSSHKNFTHFQNTYSYRAGPHFSILGLADISRQKIQQDLRKGAWNLTSSLSSMRLGSGVVLDRRHLIFSATVGMHFRGQEKRELKNSQIRIDAKRQRILLPYHTFGVGVKARNMMVFSQISLGEFGTTILEASSTGVLEGEDAGQKTQQIFDEEYRSPLRAGIHGLLDLHSEIQLAASVDYEGATTGQWSQAVDADGRRITTDSPASSERWQLSGGLRYYAKSDLSVAFSLSYRTSSYPDKALASLEHDHLGGLSANFDVEFATHSSLRFMVGTTYQYPVELETFYDFTEEGLLTHQHIPIKESSAAKLTETKYGVLLSVAYIPPAKQEDETTTGDAFSSPSSPASYSASSSPSSPSSPLSFARGGDSGW